MQTEFLVAQTFSAPTRAMAPKAQEPVRKYFQADDPAAGGKLKARAAPALARAPLAGIPEAELDNRSTQTTTVSLLCYIPAPAPALAANPLGRLLLVRDHLHEMFPGDLVPGKNAIQLMALGEYSTATYNAFFAGAPGGPLVLIEGFLELTDREKFYGQRQHVPAIPPAAGRRQRGQENDLAMVPGFGAGAILKFVGMGSGGRGGYKSDPEEMRAKHVALIRHIHSLRYVCTNVQYETETMPVLMDLGSAATEETHVEPLDDTGHFEPDTALMDGERILNSVAPQSASTAEEWIDMSGAEEHLRKKAPNLWLGKRNSWRNMVKDWFASRTARPVNLVAPDFIDFSAHPHAWRWAFFRELVERDPRENRVLVFVQQHADCGLGAWLRQMSLPEHALGEDLSHPGYAEVRVHAENRTWYDGLVAQAARGARREVVVLRIDKGEASSTKQDKLQRLANDIAELCQQHRVHHTGTGKRTEARMSQHVVVVMHPPCDALLGRLADLEVWLAYGSSTAQTDDVVWHFPGLVVCCAVACCAVL